MYKIFSILNKEFNINQAAFLLGFFAFVSQLLALLRDRSLAHFIGPSAALDAYYAAFRVPDFIFISIASLASFTVLIPFFIEKLKSPNDHKEAHRFLNNIFSSFGLAIFLVSLLAFILMPLLARAVAPGFSAEAHTNLVALSRIMLLSPIMLGFSNLLATITQVFNRFFIYALCPVFYNLGIIIGVLFFYPIFGLPGLAFGVVLGALFHLALQIPAVIQNRLIPRPLLKIDFQEVKTVIMNSLPRTLGLALGNISIIVILALASFISEGAVSIFNFSFNLQSVPLAIFGVSYSVAAFPTLARLFSRNEKILFIDKIISAARQMIFWTTPVVVLFIVLRAQIVRSVLGSGNFSWSDTRLTAAALALFSVSILAQGLILLFVRGYYAAGRTKRPLLVNLAFTLATIISAFVFLKIFRLFPDFRGLFESLFRVEGIAGTEVLMLPLAYSFGAILNMLVLWRLFKSDFLDRKTIYLQKTFFEVLGASLVIGIVSYKFLGVFSEFFNLETFWGIFSQGLFAGLIGIFAGVIILKLLKNEEFENLLASFKTKLWKTEVISASQDDLK